jgi:hypothetical protein
MSIPRFAIAPDFPDVEEIFILAILEKINFFAPSFAKNHLNLVLELLEECTGLTGLNLNRDEEKDFTHAH